MVISGKCIIWSTTGVKMVVGQKYKNLKLIKTRMNKVKYESLRRLEVWISTQQVLKPVQYLVQFVNSSRGRRWLRFGCKLQLQLKRQWTMKSKDQVDQSLKLMYLPTITKTSLMANIWILLAILLIILSDILILMAMILTSILEVWSVQWHMLNWMMYVPPELKEMGKNLHTCKEYADTH